MEQNLEERLGAMSANNTLFIGLGNVYMGDDAAGMLTMKVLAKAGLRVIPAGNDLMGAMHTFPHDVENAVFVDAAGMGLDPGDVRILTQEEVDGRCISTHENNFPLAMHYMKCLNPSVNVIFLGIQFNTLEMEEEPKLSPEVKKSVENLIRTIVRCIKPD